MYRRKRQPLLGTIGFPYGKIHLGERVAQAAARELKEKTGLTAHLRHYGDGYAVTHEDGVPTSQIMFHFFYGTQPQGELATSTEAGEAMWLTAEQIASDPRIIPNVPEFLGLIRRHDGSRFFAELSHHLQNL